MVGKVGPLGVEEMDMADMAFLFKSFHVQLNPLGWCFLSGITNTTTEKKNTYCSENMGDFSWLVVIFKILQTLLKKRLHPDNV